MSSSSHTIIEILTPGESQHETYPKGHLIRDPSLTPLGMKQCRTFCNNYPTSRHLVTRVLCSPLRRAIETYMTSFEPDNLAWAWGTESRVRALLVRELIEKPPSRTSGAYMMGSPTPELREEFGDFIDTRLLSDGWWFWNGQEEYDDDDDEDGGDQLVARGRKARGFIFDQTKQAEKEMEMEMEMEGRKGNGNGNARIIVCLDSRELLPHLVRNVPRDRIIKHAESITCRFVDNDDDEAAVLEYVPEGLLYRRLSRREQGEGEGVVEGEGEGEQEQGDTPPTTQWPTEMYPEWYGDGQDVSGVRPDF
ncbi:hypothetical protein GGS20DRAFT_593394 [Poronia punctata]|nr:hypothetical protein GGS20DRAFT_593394 [Poronia punctata]